MTPEQRQLLDYYEARMADPRQAAIIRQGASWVGSQPWTRDVIAAGRIPWADFKEWADTYWPEAWRHPDTGKIHLTKGHPTVNAFLLEAGVPLHLLPDTGLVQWIELSSSGRQRLIGYQQALFPMPPVEPEPPVDPGPIDPPTDPPVPPVDDDLLTEVFLGVTELIEKLDAVVDYFGRAAEKAEDERKEMRDFMREVMAQVQREGLLTRNKIEVVRTDLAVAWNTLDDVDLAMDDTKDMVEDIHKKYLGGSDAPGEPDPPEPVEPAAIELFWDNLQPPNKQVTLPFTVKEEGVYQVTHVFEVKSGWETGRHTLLWLYPDVSRPWQETPFYLNYNAANKRLVQNNIRDDTREQEKKPLEVGQVYTFKQQVRLVKGPHVAWVSAPRNQHGDVPSPNVKFVRTVIERV